MTIFSGWGVRARGLFTDSKGPWGPGTSGDDADDGSSGPWNAQPKRHKPAASSGNVTALDALLRRSRARFSRGGGQFPHRPNASFIFWAVVALIGLWVLVTSTHSIAPKERGVVTRFGRYVYTLPPGVGMTLPSPIERVKKIDTGSTRTVNLGSDSGEDLMLTGDQNLINVAYSVRWNINDPKLYLFALAEPDETIRQVAESAMRAVISQVTLQQAMGDKRSDIEAEVARRMQNILDSYHSGIVIQGVAITQADPPQAVNDAFKDVSAAQQDAQSYKNAAQAYAQQLIAKAQGEATAFDKVYQQYKLAPEVTRRRMYYETMENVLSKVPKTIVDAHGVVPYLPVKPGSGPPQPPKSADQQDQQQ